MVDSKEIYTTHIQLGCIQELGLGEHRLREVVINLDVAKLEECAVKHPEGVSIVVVGIAG